MLRVKKSLWIGVVVGIAMIIVPSISSQFGYKFSGTAEGIMMVFGFIIMFLSLIFG